MVYSPRKDSFMMKRFLKKLDLSGKQALDMGTGSGILAETMSEKGAEVTAADINDEAIKHVKNSENLELKKIVQSDLFSSIMEKFDVITFNPPYLPQTNPEINQEREWYGGKGGIQIIEKFLQDVEKYLYDDGAFFLVASSKGDIEKIIREHKLIKINKKKLFFEELYILTNEEGECFKQSNSETK